MKQLTAQTPQQQQRQRNHDIHNPYSRFMFSLNPQKPKKDTQIDLRPFLIDTCV